MISSKKRRRVANLMRSVGSPIQNGYVSSGIGKPSFVHVLIVIFLEFFAWGLLTDQVITVSMIVFLININFIGLKIFIRS